MTIHGGLDNNTNWEASKFYLINPHSRVLYFSMHRYDFGAFWPKLRISDFDLIGEKEGVGFNINLPLNKVTNLFKVSWKILLDFKDIIWIRKKGGLGNSEYLAAFYHLLLPIAYEASEIR